MTDTREGCARCLALEHELKRATDRLEAVEAGWRENTSALVEACELLGIEPPGEPVAERESEAKQ